LSALGDVVGEVNQRRWGALGHWAHPAGCLDERRTLRLRWGQATN